MPRFQNPPSFLSQNVPLNEQPPCSPTGAPMERVARSRAFFYTSLEFINKGSPNKNCNPTILAKSLGKERPPMFPKTESLWKQTPTSIVLLSISFGSPVKKPSAQFLLIQLPQREMLPFQTPPFIFQMSPLPDSPAGPLWRRTPVSRWLSV